MTPHVKPLTLKIPLADGAESIGFLKEISKEWGFAFRLVRASDPFFLEVKDGCLRLVKKDTPKPGAVCVDFLSKESLYRLKRGGGRDQAVARAVGLKKGKCPSVVDATAGLGRDAFVLASLGCRVRMIERSLPVAALLADGLRRARRDAAIGGWVRERLSLIVGESVRLLGQQPFTPDVIYLDPMFPTKKKKALVKKEMQVLKALLDGEEGEDRLLAAALKAAGERVVVKRPAHADALAGHEPQATVKTPKNRFDIYFPNL